MNTFLPSADFEEVASVLDKVRLNKQITEARQIISVIESGKAGTAAPWGRHPAVIMWIGSTEVLKLYYNLLLTEWWFRGGRGDRELYKRYPVDPDPEWLGDPRLHASHRSALLYKDPTWYGQFGWEEQPAVPNRKGSLPYLWPSKHPDYRPGVLERMEEYWREYGVTNGRVPL